MKEIIRNPKSEIRPFLRRTFATPSSRRPGASLFFQRLLSPFGVPCSLPVLLLLLVPAFAFAWNYETPTEFIVEADLDGDGLLDVVIVDKVTGAFRVGYQTTLGVPAWAAARASGIDNVTGVSAGRVLSILRDTLAVAGPAANRVNLLEAPTDVSPALPVPVFIPSIGPNLVAAVDIGGAGNNTNLDLYITSQENPGSRETLVRNTGSAQSIISDNSLTQVRGGANFYSPKLGQPGMLGLFNRTPGGSDTFSAYTFASGAPSLIHLFVPGVTNSPRAPEFLSARFNNADLYAQMLVYQPGSSNLLTFEYFGSYGLTVQPTYNLGNTIQLIQMVTNASQLRLLVLFGPTYSNATIATVFSYDGLSAPVPVQSWTNANGFTGAGVLGSGNFSLLGGDGAGHSVKFQNIGANGGGYTNGLAGDLPRLSPYSGGANVLMFAGEPFVSQSAQALKTVRVGDWSSAPVLSGGSPPTVTVRAENFSNATNGLVNPVSTALGTAPGGTTYALVNQYTNPISIFSRRSAVGETAGEVTISPPAGEYASAIKVLMSVTPATWFIKYRLTAGAAWQTYTAPFFLFSNATIQFYGRNPANTTNTPIRSSAYTFTVPPDRIDSDGDGVPDYIEVAKGLDPTKGPDSDGDGFTDLEELIRGTDPANSASAPTNFPAADFKQIFDLVTTPRAVNAAGGISISSTGVAMRVYGLDGRLMSTGGTTNFPAPPAGVSNNAAPMIEVQPVAGEAVVAQASDQHFDINVAGDRRTGRELVGLVPVPPLNLPALPPVDLSLGAGALNAWTSSVANLVTNLPRTQVNGDITYLDTLAALLFEAKVGEILVARGTNYGTNLTLFPFRPADSGRTPVNGADLANIESYYGPTLRAYRLTNMLAHFRNNLATNGALPIAELRNLSYTVYRLSAAYNNTNPGAFKLPVEEIRYFLKNAALESGYASNYTGGVTFATAWLGASNLLATVPPRPTSNVVIEVVTAGPGVATTFRVLGTATPVTLWQRDGSPCALPASFDVLPGSRLALFGHVDLAGPGLPVEVIAVSVASVPLASDGDANGDLLIDSWQNVFFGGGVGNPFADPDGDGYSNLQEMLSGTDPNSSFSIPGVPAASFSPPVIGVTLGAGSGTLIFDWPAAYIGNFNFGIRASADVASLFATLPSSPPVSLGGNTFSINFTLPAGSQQFFFLTIALQP